VRLCADGDAARASNTQSLQCLDVPHWCVCECLQFNDDWTPAHLTGGAANLYRGSGLALKGEEWRQPGLVALASKLAKSAREHRPIKVRVPASYEPKTGASPWADEQTNARSTAVTVVADENFNSRGSLVLEEGATFLQVVPSTLRKDEPINAEYPHRVWVAHGGAACTGSREVADPQLRVTRSSVGAREAMVAPPPHPAALSADAIELVSMPPPKPVPPPTSGPASAPQPAVATSDSVSDFVSHRLKKMFSPLEASAPLDA
jgi:hypothetical protein